MACYTNKIILTLLGHNLFGYIRCNDHNAVDRAVTLLNGFVKKVDIYLLKFSVPHYLKRVFGRCKLDTGSINTVKEFLEALTNGFRQYVKNRLSNGHRVGAP